MGWQPGLDSGAGESPDRDPGVPGVSGGPSVRDPRLARFAGDGSDSSDGSPAPSGALALLADELSGLQRRCLGATDNELVGLVRSWAAIESWAASAKLGVIRELIRRDGVPSPGSGHGDLPDEWSQSLRYELAQALACSTQSAETTAWLAWEQEARLPGIGALLDNGTLTFAKARAVTETFRFLTDADASRAEAMIAGQLKGKTYPQVLRLAEQAALTVDPELAERRREQTQQRDARVSFFREQAGTAALSGRDLPPDEALTAMSSVNARAEQYKESGAFGGTRMDVLRAYAYLDLLNNVTADARIASAEPQDEAAEAADDLAWAKARAAKAAAEKSSPRTSHPGGDHPGGDHPDGDHPDDDGPDLGGSGGTPRPAAPGPRPDLPATGQPRPPRPADLIVPLATLLGVAEHPGEIQGFGLLDPTLARDLAAAAAASQDTKVCVTVTSPEGYAVAHGCARPSRLSGPSRTAAAATTVGAAPDPSAASPSRPASLAGLAARLNLTIPASALPHIATHNDHNGRTALWTLTPFGDRPPPNGSGPPSGPTPPAGTAPPGTAPSGPTPPAGTAPSGTAPPGATSSPGTTLPARTASPSSDGYVAWALTLPGGRQLTVCLDPVPVYDCDHRYETRAYQPTDKLRHLVQVRDGTCTFPSCNRHARDSDFEHATPHDQGGRTCACNAGARSRACHRVKQTPGWTVTQPRPGWHQWTTPAGHVYTQEPKRYPA